MHDAILFEEQGLPATVVVTHVFPELARRTAQNLGASDYEPIIVPHPIFTRDQAWIEAEARRVADEVVSRLTGTAVMTGAEVPSRGSR